MTDDAHARPTGAGPEPLYDVDVATPTHAERARTMAMQLSTGTLCTLALEPPGHPYGSLVTVAFEDGDPVFLLSALAEHTKNLQSDPRASLLVSEDVSDDPLANGRVTLLGSCRLVEGDAANARAAFLAVHPNSAYYADFKDFGFWRLSVESLPYGARKRPRRVNPRDNVGDGRGRWCADSARWASSGRHVDHRDRRRVMISM